MEDALTLDVYNIVIKIEQNTSNVSKRNSHKHEYNYTGIRSPFEFLWPLNSKQHYSTRTVITDT